MRVTHLQKYTLVYTNMAARQKLVVFAKTVNSTMWHFCDLLQKLSNNWMNELDLRLPR